MNPLLFTDPAFLFFFAPIVLTGYWIVPAGWRNGFLLAASVALYGWGENRYVAALLVSILINWLGGMAIVCCPRVGLGLGVGANLILLWSFKGLAGLSFYTFMGISYLVDLYRRDLERPSSLGRVALFLAMFPHLIAGPIVRMTEIGGQFGRRVWTVEAMVAGIRRFVIGLGKKVLIANMLAAVSDAVFALPVGRIPTGYAWLGLICYTLQIYFDFSGYSDMAIGLARMLGFRFPENFNYPYVSQSVTEFWRRWHITLSNWLRDYLFFPLGVRGGALLLVRNLFIVFVLCGLWHGVAWTFIAWGLWHGLLLSLEQLGLEAYLRKGPAIVRSAYTLGAVAAGWILFRAVSLTHAAGFAKALFGFGGTLPVEWVAVESPAIFVAVVAGVVGCVPLRPVFAGLPSRVAGVAEFAVLSAVFAAALAGVAGSTYKPFIYFRF